MSKIVNKENEFVSIDTSDIESKRKVIIEVMMIGIHFVIDLNTVIVFCNIKDLLMKGLNQ